MAEILLTCASVSTSILLTLFSLLKILIPIRNLHIEDLRKSIPDAPPFPDIPLEQLALARQTISTIVLGSAIIVYEGSPGVEHRGLSDRIELQGACKRHSQRHMAEDGRRAVVAWFGVEDDRDERKGLFRQHLARGDTPFEIAWGKVLDRPVLPLPAVDERGPDRTAVVQSDREDHRCLCEPGQVDDRNRVCTAYVHGKAAGIVLVYFETGREGVL